MKSIICSVFGVVGSTVSYLLGGWDMAVVTLLIFMVIDYITGIIVAGVFHKSKKTESGSLESRVGWKGLVKKFVTLLFIIIAVRLDMLIGNSYVRDAVCIAFITNETLSIIENAGLMGIPLPNVITKALEILKSKEDTTE